MKKLLALLLCLCMLMAPATAFADGEGDMTIYTQEGRLTAEGGEYDEDDMLDEGGEAVCWTAEESESFGAALTTVKLPSKVKAIGSDAFNGCSRMTSITIPKGLKSIGANAFYGCFNLRDVYYDGTGEDWAKISIASGNDTLNRATKHFKTAYRALVVGNEMYKSGQLAGTTNDMYAMAALLVGFSNGYTGNYLNNGTAARIKSLIKETFANATDADTSLFYYAGHGLEGDSTDNGSIVGVNFGSAYPNDYITPRELASILNQVPGRVIVIMDSCFSGATIGRDAKARQKALDACNQNIIDAFAAYDTTFVSGNERSGELARSKFIVITAAKGTQFSSTVTVGGKRCGLFTYYFTDGCGMDYFTGACSLPMPADKNRDKRISVSEIHTYTRDKASDFDPSQTAQCYASNTSEVLFWR